MRKPAAIRPARGFSTTQASRDDEAGSGGSVPAAHSFAQVNVVSAEPSPASTDGPIQRFPPWDWLKSKFSRSQPQSRYPSGLDPEDYWKYDLNNATHEVERQDRFESNRNHERFNAEYDRTEIDSAIDTPSRQMVQSGVGKAVGAISGAGSIARTVGQSTTSLAAGQGIGMGAAPLGALVSLGESVGQAHRVATSDDKAADKGLLALDAVSNLGRAATNTVSGVQQAANLSTPITGAAKVALHHLAPIAAPAAIVTGGADVITGAVGTGLALHRRNKLSRLQEQAGPHEGTARFAKQTQTTKGWSNAAKVIGGGLAIGGGAALLAAGLSNPVGWGLLGGAAAIGMGIAAFKKARKHYLGRKILKDPAYQRQLRQAGVVIPDERDLELHGGWNKFKNLLTTKSSRAHDLVRGQLATKLADDTNESDDNARLFERFGSDFGRDIASRGVHNRDIRSAIGIRESESEPLLDGPEREAWKKRRGRQIARALEG